MNEGEDLCVKTFITLPVFHILLFGIDGSWRVGRSTFTHSCWCSSFPSSNFLQQLVLYFCAFGRNRKRTSASSQLYSSGSGFFPAVGWGSFFPLWTLGCEASHALNLCLTFKTMTMLILTVATTVPHEKLGNVIVDLLVCESGEVNAPCRPP